MAEEPKKEAPVEVDYHGVVKQKSIEIAGLFLLAFALIAWFERYTASHRGMSFQDALYNYLVDQGIWDSIRSVAISYIVLANLLCLFFLISIIYCAIRLRQIHETWYKEINPVEVDIDAKPKNQKWERVVIHASSENSSDWRLAILEADIILSDLLDHLNYIGDSIGDRLKKVNPGDMQTLNNAWEAHKIRNAIAHEGSNFTLSQRESQRVVGLYESVFREFDYI